MRAKIFPIICIFVIFCFSLQGNRARTLANETNTSGNDAGNVCSNPLLLSANGTGIVKGLATSAVASNLKYCSFLNNTASCCEAAVINNISDSLNNIQTALDKNIKNLDVNVSESRQLLKDTLENYKKIFKISKNLMEKVKKIMPDFKPNSGNSSWVNNSIINNTFPDFNNGNRLLNELANRVLNSMDMIPDFKSLSSLQTKFDLPAPFLAFNRRTKQLNATIDPKGDIFDEYIRLVDGLWESIKSDFVSFQKNRKKCFDYLLKGFSKFYCLACSANSNSFFAQGKLSIHIDFCTSLVGNCYDYLSYNELISGFVDSSPLRDTYNVTSILLNAFETLGDIMDTLIDKMNQIKSDPVAAMKDLADVIKKATDSANIMKGLENHKSKPFRYSSIPATCKNSTNCNFICTKFLNVHGLDLNIALNNAGVTTEARLLAEDEGVSYSENGYKVDSIVSGVEGQLSVPEDPANVGDSGNYAGKLVLGFALAVIALLN